jgi:hypothetical protein
MWRYEQNLENVSKIEEFEFSAKFAWKLSFFENQGSFEPKIRFWTAINSIRGTKFGIFILKFYFPLALRVWHPQKLTKLKSVENSSQNPPPGKLA